MQRSSSAGTPRGGTGGGREGGREKVLGRKGGSEINVDLCKLLVHVHLQLACTAHMYM